MSIGERIKSARQAKGWSQGRLAEAIGQAQTTISSWEIGRTKPDYEHAERIAQALDVDVLELERPEKAASARGLPLIGRVGAGGEGLYADDFEMGAAEEYLQPLPGMAFDDDIIVLQVDGDSMVPAVFDGDLAFFGPIRHDVEALVNKRVMARTADGRKFFKVLKRGSRPGLWTLRSLNPATPDIEDVRVDWVLPYRGSRPR